MGLAWLDDTRPSVVVTGRPDVDVGLTLEVVAQCAGEVTTWSSDAGIVPAGGSLEVVVPGIAELAFLAWSDWGVRLVVRFQVSDLSTGRVLQLLQAPDRVVWFDDAGWSLRSAEEVAALVAPDGRADGSIVVAVEPGDAAVEVLDVESLEVE